jgi:hypothetical protein
MGKRARRKGIKADKGRRPEGTRHELVVVDGKPLPPPGLWQQAIWSSATTVGHYIARLGDGEIGWCMDPLRPDNCLRAAVATALQVPIDQVPDPRLDARFKDGDDPDEISARSWEKLADWSRARGLELRGHLDTLPTDRERWVGVVEPDMEGDDFADAPTPFTAHCLVMSYGDILFDPSISLFAPEGQQLRTYDPSQITYGLTFNPIQGVIQ